MTLGLCCSPRIPIPHAEVEALRPSFLRSILYQPREDLDWLLSFGLPVWITLNNEIAGGWDAYDDALRLIAVKGRGRVLGVSQGNELSGYWAKRDDDVPPEFGASLIRRAAPILRPAGIAVYTDALAGPRWFDYLVRLLELAGDDIDGVDSHAGYGRRPYRWGQAPWMFGTLEEIFTRIRMITDKPIVMSEMGVKVPDAGGEDQQAAFLRATNRELSERGIRAAWFAYHDHMQTPEEQTEGAGFGLVRADGTRRPAWEAFANLAKSPESPPPFVPEAPMPDYRALARRYATEAGIDPGIFERQIDQESGFNPNAYNPSGATGIAQIIPRFHPGVDPRDPDASLRYAARWMHSLLSTNGGSYPRALASYNWGPGNVASWDGRRETLPGETRHYLDVILGSDWSAPVPVGPQPALTFNANSNALAQNDSWSCAPTSLRWALWSVGRKPAESWIEETMVAEGVVSHGQGLLDASGAGLAAFVERHYEYDCGSKGSVSYDEVRAMAGTKPVLIGGRSWGGEGHWSGVRGYDPARGLLLANPADGWGGIGQVMDRQQWAARGPWSAMWIEVQGASIPPVGPEPPPSGPTVPELQGIIREYEKQVAALREEIKEKSMRLYLLRDDLPDRLGEVAGRVQELAAEARKIAEEAVGPKAG